MDLIIIRHALPVRADGDSATADPPLSDVGHAQAEATAAFLATETIDHVVASPLQRASQTAQPLAGRLGVDVEVVEGLREIDPFGGSYIPAEEITAEHPVVQGMAEDPHSLFASAGGFERFRTVVTAAFDDIVARNRGKRVAVFCHGTVIGAYLTTILGHDDPFVLLPDYCGISRVLASANGLRTLRSANETGHLRSAGRPTDV